MTDTSPQFSSWLDEFFASYYRQRPVNATFIGEHAYDHLLPDFSEQGADETRTDMQSLLRRLQALPDEPLTPAQQVDRRLAEGFLRIQTWEYSSNHFHRGNPSSYSGEAIFSIIGLFLTAYAPLSQRVSAAIERMQQIPALLAQGEGNVRSAPKAWTERAIRECQGALALFGQGIDLLMAQERIEDQGLRAAADVAAAAFARLDNYLRTELKMNANDDYACGEAVFDLMMHQGHCLDLTSADIAAYAEEAWAQADSQLSARAADFDATTPADALAKLADLHPTADAYYGRYAELWQSCYTTAQEQKLLTWPEFPIDYVPRPDWVRAAAPYLYFLFYRSPAAVNRPPVHQYLVAPLEPTLSASEQETFLRSNNDSVIKLNHVVHHGSIGHHVQNWHAFQAESQIGRIAAVDCASRTALFCGTTMAEGWACYAADLMGETGFLTPLERYAEAQSRRRMSARAIVDVKLHNSEFTLAEAANFYVHGAAMSPDVAYSEAVKNSMFPGAAMIYLFGADSIHSLRNELAAREGDSFDLARFHDRFLSYGSIPVALISADMRK